MTARSPSTDTDAILALAGGAAYDAGRGTGRFIFYNVGPLTAFGKFDVIALGETQAAAERAMEETLPASSAPEPRGHGEAP